MTPEERAEQACGAFTTDSYAHAHDLGRVPCVNCGWRFQEHFIEDPNNRKATPSIKMIGVMLIGAPSPVATAGTEAKAAPKVRGQNSTRPGM